MKNKGLTLGIAVIVAMVAVGVFIVPENRGKVTGLFQSKNSFAAKSKSAWFSDLASSKYSVRDGAHAALVYQEGGPSAVPILVAGLKSDSAQVRAECADILGSYKGQCKAAIQPLVDTLGDNQPEVKVKASDSLQKLAPDSKVAIPTLTKLLKDPEQKVRIHAAGCLGGFGPDARPAWTDLVRLNEEEKDPDVRDQIAKVMYTIDGVAAEKAGVVKPIAMRKRGGLEHR
jgi:HEAT repeat protein